jgi:ectoine hydroxylase-related dioxygenase (phytanoyl-CoA dioxygenase family)
LTEEPFDKNLYPWNHCKTKDQNKLKNTFNNYGSIIIPDILSKEDCDEILEIISREERNKNNESGSINSNFRRKDIFLPVADTKKFIKKIYDKIQPFIDDLIPEGKIVESSSLISYPGAYPQIWHADTVHKSSKEGNLVSFGVALDDITPNMGPLELFLESNKMYNQDTNKLCSKFNIKTDHLSGDFDDGKKYQQLHKLCKIQKYKKVNCSCSKGSMVIWSSKVIHRGGENLSKRRPLFYFSLLGKGVKPYGATYSLKKKDTIKYIKEL